jgi:putative intracellular protease/amidase
VVLVVLTSHNILGSTGQSTGFWLEEFTAPYSVFQDAGEQVTVASPKGGQPPIDPKRDGDAGAGAGACNRIAGVALCAGVSAR